MKKLISISLVLVMMLSLLVGCDFGQKNEKELTDLTIYPAHALSAGEIGGYQGDALAKYAGVKAEIWAYSAEKTTAILASGDLPDIMYVPVGETLQTLVETGKVLCLDDYLDDIPLLKDVELINENLDYLRNELKDYTNGKVWGIPVQCGTKDFSKTIINSTGIQPVKLKWEAYEKIGAPEIKSHWDLVDVMDAMLKAMPTDKDGNKMYGTVLSSKADGTYFTNLNWWMTTHGYHYNQLQYFCDLNLDTSTVSSIFEDDSLYKEGLKWLNALYRKGLIDPDSFVNDKATQVAKVDNGMCMIPAGNMYGYPAGGYYEYLIPGTKIYQKAANYIPLEVICINKDTENLEGCLAFINMMCNPDAVFEYQNGPAGDMWYTAENGVSKVSRDYLLWRGAGNPINGFPFSNGTEWTPSLNLKTVYYSGKLSMKDADGKNLSTDIDGWPEVISLQLDDPTFKQWQETTGKFSWMEWLEEEDAFLAATPYDNFRKWIDSEKLPDDLNAAKSACNKLVIEQSWLLVMAESDAQFEQIWDKMVQDCMDGGAQGIIDWRMDLFEAAQAKYDSMYGK